MSEAFDIDAARRLAAEAQARAEAATPGPWRATDTDQLSPIIWSGDYPIIKTKLPNYDEEGWFEYRDEDAAFIAAARTDVPALAAQLAAACDVVDEVKALYTDKCVELAGVIEGLTVERDEAMARNDLFSDCLHRALKLWQAAHPAASYWPDGAVNIAWVMAENARLTAERDALREALNDMMNLIDEHGSRHMRAHGTRIVNALAALRAALEPQP